MSHSSASDTMPNKSFCSLMSQQNKEDPIGSAASHTRYLFVEVPFPWDYNVSESRYFPVMISSLTTSPSALQVRRAMTLCRV
ncbi:hypothetical protein SAMN04487909_11696 [Aneurinibacillus migulanus]|uniref:Uncharacterized protein n=1 Tax=Aneurinibacillus migulanus TaxID=47500 RepID=A0A1G8T5W1_ANEMI|nr:hypothetical protein SAMN04487909_11696 [Aneurinibacillus migulanus]